MEIKQEPVAFSPVAIIFEERFEAEAFFSVVDKVENYRNNENSELELTNGEAAILVRISDARTNGNFTL